jgi:SAM-dependent methyltransferase
MSEKTKAVEKTIASYNWQIDNGVAHEFAERTDGKVVAGLLVGLPPESVVLDLGCCTGALAKQLVDHGCRWRKYIGLDLSEKAVEIFKRREIKGTEPLAGDATDLGRFNGMSFDAILCSFLIQDLPRQAARKMLRDVRSLLRPDGLLVVVLTVHPSESRELGEDYKAKVLAERGIPGKYAVLWSKKDIVRAMKDLGFAIQGEVERTTPAQLIESYISWRAAQPTVAADGASRRR